MVSDTDLELGAIRARKLAELQRETQRLAPTAAPVALTDDSFWPFVRGARVVLVDFWAAWCGPCRMIAPSVELLARDYTGRLSVGKVNVDENPKTPGEFGIRSIPTLLLFREGKLVDALIGAVSRDALFAFVQRWL